MTISTLMKERQNCIQLKTSFAPCAVLQIIHYDLEKIRQEVASAITHAPKFFLNSPIVLDLEKISTFEIDNFAALKNLLLTYKLIPIGIRGGNERQQAAAEKEGLPNLMIGKVHHANNSPKNEPPSPMALAKIMHSQIRSGTRVYAKGTDLIVTSSVSAGAELLADGHIHVYGPLRGRALAGVQGNVNARIFCCKLEAELISIAGYYLTKEDIQALPVNHGMIQVYLDDKKQVQIESVST